MDWKDVGRLVAPIAPVAGSILGGLIPFPGGSLIGEALGKGIAAAFGVPPTPEAVSDAVTNAGRDEALAKINAATEQARIQVDGFVDLEKATLAAMVANAGQVNTTMQAELGREHPFYTGWRPFIGWVFGVVALAYGLMLVAATALLVWRANDAAAALQALRDAWPLYLSYFGPLGAAVGVMINARSSEKKAAIENSAPMPNAKPSDGPFIVRPGKPISPPAPPVKPAPARVVTTARQD